MCDKSLVSTPNSRLCQDHREPRPYGYNPEVEAAVADALLPLVDRFGLDAVKYQTIVELHIWDGDVS